MSSPLSQTPATDGQVPGGAGEDGVCRVIGERGDVAFVGAEIAHNGASHRIADADSFVVAAFCKAASIGSNGEGTGEGGRGRSGELLSSAGVPQNEHSRNIS